MADFFDALGQAFSNRISNRLQDVQNTFENPGEAFQNRFNTAMGQPATTSTNQTETTPPITTTTPSNWQGQTNEFGGMEERPISPEQSARQAAMAQARPVAQTTPFDMGEMAGVDQAVARQAAMAQQPQPAPQMNLPVVKPAVPQQDYNASIAQQESGGNTNIGYHDRNKSTAFGPYGMTAGAYQDARRINPSLPADITQANPQQLTQAQNAYTQQNTKYLQAYGIEPTQQNLQAAHFLGAKGLSDYLKNGTISPAAAAANGGEEKVRQIVNARLGGQAAPASGAVSPNAPQAAKPYDMGEMAGVDRAVAQQAAINAGQPQISQAQQDAAMAAEMQRQRHYEDLNSGDPKRLIALTDNPDKSISTAAAGQLADIFKDKKLQDYAQNHVEGMLARGQIPNPDKQKGEEGSYIKAYLFNRLGLTDLARQEQEKISPTKQHMPVMVGDQRYSAVYSKDGQLLSAKDETGKPADDATLNKIAANAFASKGATTGQSMMKDADGNIWSHTTTPGTNQVIWTNQSTGKAQTTAPTGLTPFGQINPVTRANISLATSAERMMLNQNNKDKAAGLTPTYSQEAITSEKERIINGSKPSVNIEGETASAGGTAEGKPAVGVVERRGTPALEAQAQAIYNGDQQMPAGMGANNARNQWLSARVNEIAGQTGKPFDPTVFKNRQEVETAFTKGKQSDVVRSMNVAIDHLDTMNEAAKALKNGQIPLFNDIANKFAKNTGQPAPTNFDAIKTLVGSEVAKAVAGGATALGDREEIRAEINNARSPAQLAGVIDRYQKLLAGQMNGLKTQYESGGGRRWEEKINPRTKEVLGRMESEGKPMAVPAPYNDADKERRYQEFLKKRNAGK